MGSPRAWEASQGTGGQALVWGWDEPEGTHGVHVPRWSQQHGQMWSHSSACMLFISFLTYFYLSDGKIDKSGLF